ncbi:putative 30 kDa heat shock protein [Xylogone sp. PMI_703]|nr:putative 30 kDa heat shock protein [Xylogone sp. PMI_703]
MSLFQRGFWSPDPSFAPLFRLLDDFDNYNRQGGRTLQQSSKFFNPKFDVQEVDNAYNLHGELPGVDVKDIEIEFTDPQILTIRGRSERSYVSDNAGLLEGGQQKSIEGDKEKEKAQKDGNKAVEKTEGKDQQQQQQKDQPRFWISERSVGEFARSFNFPEPVDQDNVKASMNNGILSLVVPKAKKETTRKKIAISA